MSNSNIVSKTQVDSLIKRIDNLEAELNVKKELLRLLQDTCEHDYKPAGHDSHYDYQKCRICSKIKHVI